MGKYVKSRLLGSLTAGVIFALSAPASQAQDWVSVAVDQMGHWGWQFDPDYNGARDRALDHCGAPGCGTRFTVRNRCIAYVESHVGGYWFGVAHSESRKEVANIAMGACSEGAPASTCQIVKVHCQGEQD
jgi:hypothetical protein